MSSSISSTHSDDEKVAEPGSPVLGSWGDYAELEGPARAQTATETDSGTANVDSVVLVVEPAPVLFHPLPPPPGPKLQQKPDEVKLPARQSRPKTPPKPHSTTLDPDLVAKLLCRIDILEARVKDGDQALTRYGILFEQAVQRIDGQLQHMTRQLSQDSRSLDQAKRTVHALVSEAGVDKIKSLMQQQRQQQQPVFGGGFHNASSQNRDQQFAPQNRDQQFAGQNRDQPMQRMEGLRQPRGEGYKRENLQVEMDTWGGGHYGRGGNRGRQRRVTG